MKFATFHESEFIYDTSENQQLQHQQRRRCRWQRRWQQQQYLQYYNQQQ